MKILLTGYSGFIGSAVAGELAKEFELIRIGRNSDADVKFDLQDENCELPESDYLVHCAGMAHIMKPGPEDDSAFFKINVDGLSKILDASGTVMLKGVILISSVSVYGVETGLNIDEGHSRDAADSYGMSKVLAELAVENRCRNLGIPFLILRLPLVAGKNAPGNLGALQQAIAAGRYMGISNNCARKSVVLRSDVASLIRHQLKMSMPVSGIFNLTDGNDPLFNEIEEAVAVQFEKKSVRRIPFSVFRIIALLGDAMNGFPVNSKKLTKITSSLTFSSAKAKELLGWKPGNVCEAMKSQNFN